MKSKSFMLMILSMGFGLIAAIGISQVMGRNQAAAGPVIEMAPVVVAADHLEMDTVLNEELVKIENWPANIVPEDAISTIEELKDMAVTVRLTEGMPLVAGAIQHKKLIKELEIPPGKKVTSIKVSGDSVNGGILSAGDKVDVVGLFKRRTATGELETTSKTFLKHLVVFAIGNSMSRGNREGAASGAIVSLLVTEKQSEEIFFAQRTGEIKLVLRGDYTPEDENVESLDEIMQWSTEKEDGASIPDPAPMVQMPAQTKKMVIWQGEDIQEHSFDENGVLTDRRPNVRFDFPGGSQTRGSQTRPGDGSGSRDVEFEGSQPRRAGGAEFNGSDEIDRGLEQDQYPGQ